MLAEEVVAVSVLSEVVVALAIRGGGRGLVDRGWVGKGKGGIRDGATSLIPRSRPELFMHTQRRCYICIYRFLITGPSYPLCI